METAEPRTFERMTRDTLDEPSDVAPLREDLEGFLEIVRAHEHVEEALFRRALARLTGARPGDKFGRCRDESESASQSPAFAGRSPRRGGRIGERVARRGARSPSALCIFGAIQRGGRAVGEAACWNPKSS